MFSKVVFRQVWLSLLGAPNFCCFAFLTASPAEVAVGSFSLVEEERQHTCARRTLLLLFVSLFWHCSLPEGCSAEQRASCSSRYDASSPLWAPAAVTCQFHSSLDFKMIFTTPKTKTLSSPPYSWSWGCKFRPRVHTPRSGLFEHSAGRERWTD